MKHITQPLLLEFAKWCIKRGFYPEDILLPALTKEWNGALPEEMIGDDLLVDMRDFLYSLFEFALEKAKKQERYDEGEGLIYIELNPSYDSPSCVTLHHPDSKTLIYHQSFKTYHFDPKYLEDILKDALKEIREGIRLVRRRSQFGVRPTSKHGVKEYFITYHGRFGATVRASSAKEAIEKFKQGDCKYELVDDFWDGFLEVKRLSDGVHVEEVWPAVT